MELCVIFFSEMNENERKISKNLLIFTRLIVTLYYKFEIYHEKVITIPEFARRH